MKGFNLNSAIFFSTLLMVSLFGNRSIAQEKITGTETSFLANEYLSKLTDLNRFSGSVLIAIDGKIVFNKAYGYADREQEELNATHKIFQIASLSKQFTASAIMMLQEQNKLSVKDPISKYLTNCPEGWEKISLHNLLTHTSGIADFSDFPDYEKTRFDPTSFSEIFENIKLYDLEFSAGNQFRYSNSNYAILDYIIEIVSGKSAADFIKQNIFIPLKMDNSGNKNGIVILKDESKGYLWDNAKDIFIPVDRVTSNPGLPMLSTTEDLLKWDQALYDEKLLSQKSLETIFDPFKDNYGYGWFIENLFNRKWINHSGHLLGFNSQISRFPDEKTTLIILSNFDRTNIGGLTEDLAAIIFDEPYELPKPYTEVVLNENIYKDYLGEYDIFPNAPFTVALENGNLIGHLRGQKARMIPFSETEFYIKNYDLEIRFFKNDENKVEYLTWNKVTKAKKVK